MTSKSVRNAFVRCGHMVAVVLMAASVSAVAQELSEEEVTGESEKVRVLAEEVFEAMGDEDVEETEKKFDFLAMPIPMANPTVGTGLGFNAMAMYSLGENAPPSATGVFGFYTDSDSWAAGLYQMVHSEDDIWRGLGAIGTVNLNVQFYGVGNDPGEENPGIPIGQDISFLYLQALRQAYGDFYVGIRGRSSQTVTTIRLGEIFPPEWDIPDPALDSQITNIGPMMQWDSRDNTFTPVEGSLIEAVALFADESFASDFTYQLYTLEYSKFLSLSKDVVLAVRGTGCSAHGDAPFYDICLLGSDDKIRGYEAGEFRDSRMLTAQAEARWRFSDRWGSVAFLGGGWLAESFSDLSFGEALPSYGVGVRFLASEEHKVNVGIDYARGEDNDSWYFRIGEAF